MYSLALALSMLALEEAVAAPRDSIRATPEPEPLDAAGRAAQAMAWRRWAGDGRDGVDTTLTPAERGTVRHALPDGTAG